MLFKQVVEILERKEHLTSSGIRRLVEIKASMNLGLSENIKNHFNEVIPTLRPTVEDQAIKNLN
jgi:hypothetical protein